MPTAGWFWIGVLVAVAGLSTASAQAAPRPSLCVESQTGCQTPGGLNVRVQLGASDTAILAGQFVIRYDPARLTLVEAGPGRACDPASPFALELAQAVSPGSGTLTYAVGINFLEGTGGSHGPATLACLQFIPATGDDGATDVCLTAFPDPLTALLVGDDGLEVEVDNAVDCPAVPPFPVLSCSPVVIEQQCQCQPDSDDCHGIDTDCRAGVCNEATLFCEVVSVNENGVCDDDNACTVVDRCHNGVCFGVGCLNPSLCMNTLDCTLADMPVVARVTMGVSDRPIAGAQFSITYDPLALDLVDVAPGIACDPSSPFATELSEFRDEVNGQVFYSVGVGLGGGGGTFGPATLACLRFIPLNHPVGDVCLIRELNPLNTRFVDDQGQSVPVGDSTDCPNPGVPPILSCVEFEGCRIPTVSQWGLLVLTLLLLIGAKVRFSRSRPLCVVPAVRPLR